MDNVILILVLLAILGGAIFYIVRAKRKGEKCIGCPSAKTCGGGCKSGCSSCHRDSES